jgi:hypothetical protein
LIVFAELSQSNLVFVSEHGHAEPMPESAVLALIEELAADDCSPLQMVVLNSCHVSTGCDYTSKMMFLLAEADYLDAPHNTHPLRVFISCRLQTASLASKMVHRGLPYAIGWSTDVEHNCASVFVDEFYKKLALSGVACVQEAFTAAVLGVHSKRFILGDPSLSARVRLETETPKLHYADGQPVLPTEDTYFPDIPVYGMPVLYTRYPTMTPLQCKFNNTRVQVDFTQGAIRQLCTDFDPTKTIRCLRKFAAEHGIRLTLLSRKAEMVNAIESALAKRYRDSTTGDTMACGIMHCSVTNESLRKSLEIEPTLERTQADTCSTRMRLQDEAEIPAPSLEALFSSMSVASQLPNPRCAANSATVDQVSDGTSTHRSCDGGKDATHSKEAFITPVQVLSLGSQGRATQAGAYSAKPQPTFAKWRSYHKEDSIPVVAEVDALSELLRQNPVVILFIGNTGTGKSSVGKLMAKFLGYVGDPPCHISAGTDSAYHADEPHWVIAGDCLLIDSPGLSDSRGILQDEANMRRTVAFLRRIGKVHAFAYVLNEQNPRFDGVSSNTCV